MIKRLVTGGTGMVGSAIPADLKIGRKDCNLSDWQAVNAFFEKEKPEEVIHTAAKVGGVWANMQQKGDFFRENVLMNTHVIEAARLHGTKRLLAFLSTCVFPDQVSYPLNPQKIHLGPPHRSNDAYAYAKRMVDVQLQAYREQYGLEYVSVIPTNIYGPNDLFDLENGHVVPALIHRCFLAREKGEDLSVWGSGKPLREFIFSEDVAQLSDWAVSNYTEAEPLIFSTSEEVSIKEMVEMIVELLNFKGKLIWQSDKPDGQFRKPSDNSKIRSLLPNFQFTPVYEGLKKTISWFEENYPQIRK
ncbi:nucleoside-diphosphate-sugar epimerase [Saprospira grandis DSM 2844]|uniref:GDP-L-fucose synthase n=1 Tax=Saprospira grandis DSM 2844 TaxID=694433 RepID=J0P3C2_9BACT|nr:GDP-L-fucose synthase [Saprospira grandis]EJF51912.1 nucleoside-diphosphate-sugar epimerase [Saprospira grandis DSM 2844]